MTDNEGNVSRAEILPQLGPVRKSGTDILAFCPVHGDGQKHNGKGGQSLVLHESGVLRCYAGCSFSDVMKALRARSGQRAQPQPRRDEPRRDFGAPTRAYEYRHVHTGELIAVKGRFESPNPDGPKPNKTFLWRKPDGTFKDGIAPMRLEEMPLYHGADALNATGRIWFTEGESACDALIARNEVAVCGAWGASQRSFGNAFEVLRGKTVYLWPDNDQPGRDYMAAVRLALRPTAARVAVVNAPVPPKGDAVEFFQSGQTIDGLLAGTLVDTTVDILAGDEGFRVRIPTEAGVAEFLFADVLRKGARTMEAELTVSFGGGEPFATRVEIMSLSNRNALVTQLNAQFGKDHAWTVHVNTAYARLKTAHAETMAGVVEHMAGDELDSPVPFLLRDYVVEGAGTVLFGPPGRGKSWTAMLMAVSIDAGVADIWEVPGPHPCLYVNLERPAASMRRRLSKVNRALGLRPDRPLYFLNARGRSLVDVLDPIRSAIKTIGVELVVLDSISRAGMGDLNSNETGNRVMDTLNGLGVAWLAIAHSPRGDDAHAFGTVMQDAAADVMVGIVSEQARDGTLGVGLQVTKASDFAIPPMRMWAYEMDEFGLRAVRTAMATEFIEVESRERKSPREQVRDYLLSVGADTASNTAEFLGMDVSNVAKIMKGQGFVFVRQEGRNKLFGADVGSDVGIPTSITKMQITEPPPLGGDGKLPTYQHTNIRPASDDFRCQRCGAAADRYHEDTGAPACERHAG